MRTTYTSAFKLPSRCKSYWHIIIVYQSSYISEDFRPQPTVSKLLHISCLSKFSVLGTDCSLDTFSPLIVGVVDPVTQEYQILKEFSSLTNYLFPTGGSCSALDETNDILLLSMLYIGPTETFHLVAFDLNSLTVHDAVLTTYYPQGLVSKICFTLAENLGLEPK